jgi:hypothetical protein
VYGNMPVFGLARASEHVPVATLRHTAAARIGAASEDVPAVDPY